MSEDAAFLDQRATSAPAPADKLSASRVITPAESQQEDAHWMHIDFMEN
eukprot:CAMPEP_0119318214 /NCGR_PEP_ID=MMETSP1333-20130426/45769_1 /TAXON_ID=418940 /ORGANISM="Scyphosphaera apsteinii, Strain RCC1455" /LENGTH=48 /DNA_ID= /DNA_START= /DNA_END= /DNA_ORIENTATION=